MLLIVTNREDFTADFLIAELHRRGAPFVRFNTEAYPTETRLDWGPEHHSGRLVLGATEVLLSDVTAVWYRRPVPPKLPDALRPDQAQWARGEAREALEGIWRSLDVRWVNHPDRTGPAQSKPAQLRAARRLGFRVPATVMTNDPETARGFVAEQPDGAIVKPIRTGRLVSDDEERVFFTTRVVMDEAPFERLGAEPYLFQELVQKVADIRVTVIGEKALAVRIHSQDEQDSQVDFRRTDPGRLRHEPFALPAETAERCIRLVRDAGCLFGAIDLAEQADGSFVFFENNPSGQWAWIEQQTGMPLCASLADLLLAP